MQAKKSQKAAPDYAKAGSNSLATHYVAKLSK